MGDAVLCDGVEHGRRARLFRRRGGRAEAQRKQRRDAETEGEGHWRRGHEHVAARWTDEVLRERVARRENVAVELNATLGHAGGAAGEGDQRGVVAAYVERGQRLQ